MKFITRCVNCGDQNDFREDERQSIQIYFHKGSPATYDRMVIYCENCGNKEERAIVWPLDLASQPSKCTCNAR